MKKALTLTAAMAASALLAAPALADFDQPNATGMISGNLTLSQTVTLTCDFKADYSVSADGKKITVTNQVFSRGDPGCELLSPVGDWHINDDGSVVDLVVSSGSLFGSCSGTIQDQTWDNTSGGVTLSGATVPGSPGTCTITGALTTNPKVTYTP